MVCGSIIPTGSMHRPSTCASSSSTRSSRPPAACKVSRSDAERCERQSRKLTLLAEVDRRLRENPTSDWGRPFYVVVEKILMPGESLPETWPVHGTTGTTSSNALNGLFVDPRGRRAFDQIYERLLGSRQSFEQVVYESKKLITQATMSGEVTVLGHRLARISEKHRESRDFTDRSLTDAVREIIASLPRLPDVRRRRRRRRSASATDATLSRRSLPPSGATPQ